MTRLLFLLLLLVSTAAGARLYQWQDPDSGSVQFSGVPPSWYRNPGINPSPRVRVYEAGKLVDDTYIQLSDEDSATLRELAFRALQEERQVEAIKRLERAALREESRRQQAEREALRAQAQGDAASDTSEAPPEVLPDSLSAEEVDRLKAIIAGYDRVRLNTNSGAGRAARSGAARESTTSESSAEPAPTNY